MSKIMDRDIFKLEQEAKLVEARRLGEAGTIAYMLFKRKGRLSDLERMTMNFIQALSLTPDDHADKPLYLSSLGIALESRFEHAGTLSDLKAAISYKQQAVWLTPDDHPDKLIDLDDLASSFRSLFQRTGLLSDLEEVTNYQQQTVSLTPDGHTDKPRYLTNLGISFRSRFQHTGMLSDLEEAIKHQQQAVLLTPNSHTDKPIYLNHLGISVESRFLHTGALSDLEDAIIHQQQAVSLVPDDHANKPQFLSNLGISLLSRFRRTRMPSDLEEAVMHQQKAVLLAPDDHADKPWYLNNLGMAYENQFRHTGMLSDLEEAINHQRQAVLLTPKGHFRKPMYLNNIGNSFLSRFQRTGALSDLEQAIEHQQKAVWLTPNDHVDLPGYLSNLGLSFQSQFRLTRMLSDLEEAINHQQQAISLTPDAHAGRSRYINDPGSFWGTGISSLKLVATSGVGPVSLRCRASQQWARLEAERKSSDAIAAYRQAINLLSQVVWIGDPIATRYSQLTKLADIPREAAVYALDFGRPDLALEWLEHGRSVIWNGLLHLQGSVDHLRQAHPDLCLEFTQISHELQNAATRDHSSNTSDSVNNSISLEAKTRRHNRLTEKWNLLVEKIRSLPNYHDFLLPKPVSVLKESATEGPVVVINIHQHRCDALILKQDADRVLHIPLDQICYGDVTDLSKCFKDGLVECRYRSTGIIPSGRHPHGILSVLYSYVVDPILKCLGLTVVPGSESPLNLPRIWWCPTGPLTVLPLHAACLEAGAEGTFTYVISSYTPTISALLEARAVERRPFKQIVGISMSNAPNYPFLPGVETEIAHLEKLFSDDRCEILRNEQATGAQVLARMADTSWIHLACHAIEDEQEPMQSGFYLYDKRLTIMDIITKQFDRADFAFLSTCPTASGNEKVSDEAVHVAAAMLGAGYRSVIGTMWALPDEAAPRIAKKVYEGLLSGGEPDSDRAARALHEAVREARESSHDSFNYWIPFVHYGA